MSQPTTKTLKTLSSALLVVLLWLSPGALAQDEPAPAAVSASVSINSASAEELAANLVGVGQAKAEDIVRHRQAHGPFGSADELTDVQGIGAATVDKNRHLITLD